MAIITLLTDFGEKDGYVGIMKGVILGIAPHAQIVDLSHEVEAQNVLVGALTLGRCAAYFPAGTIFTGVVDPGVGTNRRPIAARLNEHYFIGPDNGLMTLLYKDAINKNLPIEIVHLTQSKYWLVEVSHSFHGRDIFSPVAAHLANGVPLEKLGPPIHDPILLEIPKPQKIERGWRGEILHIDAFGNLATNFTLKEVNQPVNIQVRYKDKSISSTVKTFGEGNVGELIATFDSAGCLAICVVNGNAAQTLKARVGDKVEILAHQEKFNV